MAYEFNGTNQRISCTAPLTTGACTLAARCVLDTAGNRIVLGIYSTTSNNWRLLWVTDTRKTRAQEQGTNGGNVYAEETGTMSTSTDSHVCAVLASSTSRTIYRDAASNATDTSSSSGYTGTEFGIGSFWLNGGHSFFWDGRISEVGVWNVDLTLAEIASLSKGFKCQRVRPQNLVFYAPLLRNLQDVRKGASLTNTNTATVTDHPRVY